MVFKASDLIKNRQVVDNQVTQIKPKAKFLYLTLQNAEKGHS